jgi:hypothetical protein
MRMFTRFTMALATGAVAALAVAVPATAGPAGPAGPGTAGARSSTGAVTPATGHVKPAAVAGKAGSKTGRPSGAVTQHVDGFCNTGDLCMWYLRGFSHSYVDFFFGDNNMADNVFLTSGFGQGQVVSNNAESAWNYDPTYTAWVCTDPDFQGACGFILPNTGGDLNPTYLNNVESLYWTL